MCFYLNCICHKAIQFCWDLFCLCVINVAEVKKTPSCLEVKYFELFQASSFADCGGNVPCRNNSFPWKNYFLTLGVSKCKWSYAKQYDLLSLMEDWTCNQHKMHSCCLCATIHRNILYCKLKKEICYFPWFI